MRASVLVTGRRDRGQEQARGGASKAATTWTPHEFRSHVPGSRLSRRRDIRRCQLQQRVVMDPTSGISTTRITESGTQYANSTDVKFQQLVIIIPSFRRYLQISCVLHHVLDPLPLCRDNPALVQPGHDSIGVRKIFRRLGTPCVRNGNINSTFRRPILQVLYFLVEGFKQSILRQTLMRNGMQALQ